MRYIKQLGLCAMGAAIVFAAPKTFASMMFQGGIIVVTPRTVSGGGTPTASGDSMSFSFIDPLTRNEIWDSSKYTLKVAPKIPVYDQFCAHVVALANSKETVAKRIGEVMANKYPGYQLSVQGTLDVTYARYQYGLYVYRCVGGKAQRM